jgi:N-acetylmuramic acid 6-phosphate etherase
MSTTENASSRYRSIEEWSAADLVDGLVESQFAAIAAVRAAGPVLAEAVEAIAERLGADGRLIYLGAGTSGRVGAADAAELPPTFNWPYERAVTLMAGGAGALQKAVENAEDDAEAAPAALRALKVGPHDVAIGIAASGRTPFVVGGLAAARAAGALTVAIVNNPGGAVGQAAEIEIVLPTGAEFLAGSTRLKAGTAQKVALNTLSTAVMIRLGYVYRGLMVEMRPTNAKLRQRAVNMVMELTGADVDRAAVALEQANGVIKLAVVMLSCNEDRAAAEARLAAVGGNLRPALL